MSNTRIQINSIVQNQLPDFVREEFPLVSEFLSEYYNSIENQSGTLDLIQNIDQYIKVDNLANLIESTTLSLDLNSFDQSILVNSTAGFPSKYGLLLIDNEIITYKSKTDTTFNECIRGFSGVTEYGTSLTFEETNSETHTQGSVVTNLSILFLKEFFKKLKVQITPGFEDREFYENLNERLFIKQSKDFYSSKGTDESFEILFRCLYGKDVLVIKPRDNVFEASVAEYRNLKFLVVEAIEGDPRDLENRTLYQDEIYNIPKSQGTVVSVEPFLRDSKEYFLLGLDYYFDTNIQSVFSEFSIHSNTKATIDILNGSTYIDVDSTVGFPEEGSLVVSLENGTFLNVDYTSKNLNQFLGCTGITQNIQKGDFIRLNAFAYSYFENDIISVRVTGVLSSLNTTNSFGSYQKGDSIKIKSIGRELSGDLSNNWFFNIPVIYNVKSIKLKDSSSAPTYEISFYDEHIFKVGDTGRITSSVGENYSLRIVSYLNSTSVEVRVSSDLNLDLTYKVEKDLLKSNLIYSENNLNIFNANVQNTYYSEEENSLYITSLSLPFYGNEPVIPNDRSITFSGTFDEEYEIFSPNHGLYTGDSVVYYPGIIASVDPIDQDLIPDEDISLITGDLVSTPEITPLNLVTGIYFIKRVTNNTFKIARSRNDIFNNRYISISGTANEDTFVIASQSKRSLERKYIQPQNLLRKIRVPFDPVEKEDTPTGAIGIFANGVEIHNYKSKDFVYYGPIESVNVLASTDDFDIINPPNIQINDSVGTGASVYPSIVGSLTRIDILDPGFDYLDEPKIIINGGNGDEAFARAKLTSFEHQVSFSSSSSTLINLSNNTIGFSSYHKFRDNESVIYDPQGQTIIGGLSTSSLYYVSVQDESTIKLHNSLNDSISGINTISLTSYGVGNHLFKSTTLKKKISSIKVIDSGFNYQTKKTLCSSVGINTASNEITLPNHGYNSGEIVVYNYTETPAAGLSATSYYVTKVDDNTIKLSNVGITSEEKNFFYKTKQYVDITSVGSGTHIFDYEPISVSIVGNIGISSVGSQNFNAVLQPIFRGEIQSIFVENGGSGYGSEDIINFNRQPEFSVESAAAAQVSPIVVNGSIVDVVISNFGSGYTSIPDLVVVGSGIGAKLVPIITNGQLISVIVENKGAGYDKNTTSINVIPAGTKLEVSANIKSWRINDVERLIQTGKISDDDGIIVDSLNEEYELQYCHKYAPRSLRKYILSENNIDGEIVYIPDLNLLNGIEQTSTSHSPILGWAYDGNPIYGPYGYSSAGGSSDVRILNSGYSKVIKQNRPSTAIYPSGFFVEDYEYLGTGDLDEHNGRFCVTPEFPQGTYAYFCTVNASSLDSSGIFERFRKPVFPYIIGNTYKSNIIRFNYQNNSNQNQTSLIDKRLIRNTTPYNFRRSNSFYNYFSKNKDNINQVSKVKSVSSSKISSVDIVSEGDNYKVGDIITYTSSDFSKVSLIRGKSVESVSVATSEFFNVEFLLNGNGETITGFCTTPHSYLNNDLISVFIPDIQENITSNIFINRNILNLNAGVGSTSYTGIVTYFNVYGNLDIRENDIYRIDSEEVKVLNVDKNNSRIRVLRNYNDTISGLSTFSVGVALTENSRKFEIAAGLQTSNQYKLNRQYYFNPIESVGLGTTSGIGAGTTLTFSNPGAGITQIFIPTKSIYIKSHDLETNTELIYSSNGGNPISVSTDGVSTFTLEENSIVYSAKISNDLIGISTVSIGVGTDGSFVGIGTTNSAKSILYFTDNGTGEIHSFTTNYNNTLKGSVSKNTVTVSTAETHGLSLRDNITISLVSLASTTLYVKYNDYHRVLTLNERSFTSDKVNIISNTITIENHRYNTGDKILYSSTSSIGGLVDQGIYYVISVSKNEIKLATSYYSSTKKFADYVNLTSTGDGSFSQVNPKINIVSNTNVIFDLSDSSLAFTNNSQLYSAFDFDFYTDPSFKNKFEYSSDFSDREVVKFGQIGVSTNAYVSLNLRDETPEELYYKLSPTNLKIAPETKKSIILDNEVVGSNTISVSDSEYSGNYSVVGVGSTTFKYNIANTVYSDFNKFNSEIEYFTSSNTANGPIFEILNSFTGAEYYDSKSLPGISTIVSDLGNNADFSMVSDNLGRITSIDIVDVGYDYPSDLTLRPTAKLPYILDVNPFYSLDKIGITSVGVGYQFAPDLVMKNLDGSLITDVDLTYSLGDNEVTILTNTKGINKLSPSIIPVNNTNGVSITSIVFDSNSKDVVVTLGSSFSDPEDFPFSIGDKVLVENVSVGVGSTARGYNSSSYNYSLFTIVNTDPNIGGVGATVSYNLSEYLNENEYPGNFDSFNSSGSIIPEKHFPLFDIQLKPNEFYIGEQVQSVNSYGIVEDWDSKKGLLKISSSDDYFVGNTIEGLTSKTLSTINNIVFNPDLTYEISSYCIKGDGWKTNKGFLNEDTQRIHDSDYYQYFSYSLKSEVQYNTWEEPVSSLNHTSGFKKFSDLQVLSDTEDFSGISTSQNSGDFVGIADLSSTIDLNCVYDFDLARENNLSIDGIAKSNQIIFNTRVLQDYIESVGNRVLDVDNFSGEFNSNPRSTRFSSVNSFSLDNTYSKFITFTKDRIFSGERQILLVSLLQNRSVGFLNQYGRVESQLDLGSFDFTISGTEGQLLFYPTKSSFNDYDVNILSFNVEDTIAGIGSTSLGDSVYIGSSTITIPALTSSPTTVVGIASTYRSAKILLQISATDGSYYETNEITILHDGTNVDFEEYGQLSASNLTSVSATGLGTYYAYYSGSNINLDFTPNSITSNNYNINTLQVSLLDNPTSTGTYAFDNSNIESSYVAISSSPSPGITTISSYSSSYDGAYYIVSVKDTTNSQYQVSEVVVLDDDVDSYISEFGIVRTGSSLGSIGATITGSGDVELTFTPNADIDTEVVVFTASIGDKNDSITSNEISFDNASINSGDGFYIGAESEIKKAFNLTHNQTPIFERYFDGSDAAVVGLGTTSSIRIPENFFVTGEEVIYSYSGAGTTSAIGIATTSVPGIGSTDKLPNTLYIVKDDESYVRIAISTENALSIPPTTVEFTSVGIGTSHRFLSKNQNSRALISIDNVIQSPIVSTAITSSLANDLDALSLRFDFTGITSFFGADLIRIDDEIMRITSIGLGTNPNTVTVRRPWAGTGIATHAKDSVITKISGNYNIVENTIHFIEAPYGPSPIGTEGNKPDERDYIGIETHSTFSGRVFIRSGVLNTDLEPYSKNYIFDSLSSEFNGQENEFTLKSNGSDISGISTSNAIVLINDIFQKPTISGNYTLSENLGITSITFTGTASSTNYDVNTASIPRGGIIVSVGSTSGLGYQPLVAAGGTAIVSFAGTISSVSIGNSGSGYRVGIQTVVNVGVVTSSTGIPNIEFIGTAAISGGHIVSVAITNPGVGYTSTNPPLVVFDSPLSYSYIPLVYTSSSSGLGTGAVANIVVGQGSSVISFEITNTGYGYGEGESLTVDIGGTTGIPTDTSISFNEFQITVDRIANDKFNGWVIGDLQLLDNIDNLFDGNRVTFPLIINGNQTTIRSKEGSNINVELTLLVFLNDVLQVPGEGYTFNGGSIITFTEPPKEGDTCKIIFYRGTSSVDTLDIDILETVKVGDTLRLNDDNISLKENSRLSAEIVSGDAVRTNVYTSPGLSRDPNYDRPVIWCRQTEDKIINGQKVAKDRLLYEPLINPSSNIIQNVSTDSTQIFVESVKTFFDNFDEYTSSATKQRKVTIISQDSITSAAATAIVSAAGTISSIIISDGGVGYSTSPSVIIENPIGLGVTQRASATALISIGGTVSSISITSPGTGYTSTNPPLVLIESPTVSREVIDEVSYDGDFGIISGVATTSVGVASTGIVFDLYIPGDSYLRDSSIVETPITVSGIQSGYYFIVFNSNVGNGLTSIYQDGSTLGIGSTFIDNIYEVASVSIGQTDVIGVGLTNVAKVTVSVSDYNGLTGLGYSSFYGEYSWGRIHNLSRISPKEFNYYNNGLVGVSTSPLVQRYNPLKYQNYSS